MTQPVVFVSMPQGRDHMQVNAARALLCPSEKNVSIISVVVQNSSLPQCFNTIWCAMLNGRENAGVTHFGMVHNDVLPTKGGWLDVFLEEMEHTGADVLSAVVPLKSEHGMTSTAIADPDDPWSHRRLSLKEVWDRPETWTEPNLAINTGLWLARCGPWMESVFFQQIHRIERRPDGTLKPAFIPEDWDFSRQCRELGLRVYATRKVPVEHEFRMYHTHSPWGTWVTDEAHDRWLAAKRGPEAVAAGVNSSR